MNRIVKEKKNKELEWSISTKTEYYHILFIYTRVFI